MKTIQKTLIWQNDYDKILVALRNLEDLDEKWATPTFLI
jgi:hypothetical protein